VPLGPIPAAAPMRVWRARLRYLLLPPRRPDDGGTDHRWAVPRAGQTTFACRRQRQGRAQTPAAAAVRHDTAVADQGPVPRPPSGKSDQRLTGRALTPTAHQHRRQSHAAAAEAARGSACADHTARRRRGRSGGGPGLVGKAQGAVRAARVNRHVRILVIVLLAQQRRPLARGGRCPSPFCSSPPAPTACVSVAQHPRPTTPGQAAHRQTRARCGGRGSRGQRGCPWARTR
jgi:hypothetical protein